MKKLVAFWREYYSLTPRLKQFRARGWIGFAIERVFLTAQLLSPAMWLFGTRAHSQRTDTEEETARRAKQVDTYVVGWFGVLVLCALLVPSSYWAINAIVGLLVAWRIFDALQTSVNVSIFDHLRVTRKPNVAHITRSVTLALWNYVEVAFAFGILYTVFPNALRGSTSRIDAYYFSGVTQLTLGADSIAPVGIGRLLVLCQGIAALLLLVILFGRFIAVMPAINDGTE